MKSYLSIPGIGSNQGRKLIDERCIAFYKYDGSNLRFEWSRSKGWYKQGSRTRLFDGFDNQFGPALPLFMGTMADIIEERVLRAYPKAERFIAYCEYFGPNSMFGSHREHDPMELRLIDVDVYKQCIIDPVTFVDMFGDWDRCAEVIFEGRMTWDFIQQVRRKELARELFEGVVCKGGERHKLWMTKIKTYNYLDALGDRREIFEQLGKMKDNKELHVELAEVAKTN